MESNTNFLIVGCLHNRISLITIEISDLVHYVFEHCQGGAYQEASRVWHAKDISIPQRTCAWMSNGFMSVNTTLGVGRVFLRSICEQYAAWGIDLGTATANLLSLHLS